MKKLLLPLLLVSPTINAEIYDYKILRVIDGDTVVIEAPYLPKPLKPELHLRILGVDTPEKDTRAKCDFENKLGHDATDFTKNAIDNSISYQIEISNWDKFGGRIDGDIIIDGKKLSQLLIDNKYAKEYHGEKKESWCKIF